MDRREYLKLQGSLILFVMSGCSMSESSGNGRVLIAPEYPLDGPAFTTLSKTFVPTSLSEDTIALIRAGELTMPDIEKYIENGIGLYTEGPGQSHLLITDLLSEEFTTPTTRKSLLYFPHFTDVHITDEETPLSFGAVTAISTGSSYRPQSIYTAQLFDCAVRTANALSIERPFDFIILTGDLTDGSQKNELQLFFDIADGKIANPDSGADDDPVAGPGNDGSDPFQAEGFARPYFISIGNHETSLIGTFPVTHDDREALVGDQPYNNMLSVGAPGAEPGLRDGSTEFGDILTEGPIPADPDREFYDFDDIILMAQESTTEPIGHGFTEDMISGNCADYVFDPTEGLPIRVISLDSRDKPTYDEELNPLHTGTDKGALSRVQLEQFLIPELNRAVEDNVLVIIGSHHSPARGSFSDDSEVSAEEIQRAILDCPNVIAHLVGHSHTQTYYLVTPAEGEDGHPYAEVMTSSLVDWPNQFRIIELVDNNNGTVSVFATAVDVNAPADSLAERGRRFAIAHQSFVDYDMQTLYNENLPKRNVEIVVPISEQMSQILAALDLPDQIETLTRL
jgi:3',5'-cyclic AMP phosphodiesterase CpdA